MRRRLLVPALVLAVVAACETAPVLAGERPAVPRAAEAPPSPRGSVRVFNAGGSHAPLAVDVAAASATPGRVARAFLNQTRAAASADLRITAREPLASGHTVVRLQESHGGVPVIGGEAVVLVDAQGRVAAASSEVLPGAAPDTTPRLTGEQAQAVALRALTRELGHADLHAQQASLAIYDPRLVGGKGPGRAVLVWDVTVSADSPEPLLRRVLVDAQLGVVALETEAQPAALARTVC
ncbi:MAG: hypothetical protein F2796_07110, partial [Actinobacteria bacterium]|nr:hypothetical protein [Actinomycetota bacterium]